MNKKILIILLISVTFICCVGKKTDKEIIEELIDNVKTEINNGNINILNKIIDNDYRDQYNRKKIEIINIVRNYLQTYSGLKVNVEGIKIKLKNNKADVELSVYFTASNTSILKKIMRKYTDKYRFLIELKKINKNWKVIYSEYEYSGI